jgi:hypothetical protein
MNNDYRGSGRMTNEQIDAWLTSTTEPLTDEQVWAWLDSIIGADPVPATNLPGSPDPTPEKRS